MTHQETEVANALGRAPGNGTARLPLMEVLKAALAAHQRGELDAAESGYRAVLAAQPRNADALQYLGVIAHVRGDNDKAIRLLRRALKAAPRNGTVHNNLASIYIRDGKQALAETHYRKALRCPDPPEDALCNLGVLQRMQGKTLEACETLEDAVKRFPGYAKAKKELAEAFILDHHYARAEEVLRAYIEAEPGDAAARARYGLVLQRLGRFEEAQKYFFGGDEGGQSAEDMPGIVRGLMADPPPAESWTRLKAFLEAHHDDIASQVGIGTALIGAGHTATGLEVLKLVGGGHPDDASVWSDIGTVLAETGHRGEGLEFLRHAAELDPDNADVYNNLGNICCDLGQIQAAIPLLQRALTLQPDHIEAHVAISRAYRENGELDKASLYAHAALALPRYTPRHFPTLAQAFRATCDFDALDALGPIWENCKELTPGQLHSMFLSLLVHTHTEDEARRFAEFIRTWAGPVERMAAAVPLPALPETRRPGPLRIGILSADLRAHSVGRFFLPLIQGYDRKRFEFYCYTPYQAVADTVQHLVRENATKFTVIDGKTDREMAEIIRSDGVDILIELNGYTQGSCIKALPYRPAPVQMTWMGYPFTLGLKDVDYMILDRFAKPPRDDLLSEEVVVMPEAWLCFRNFAEVPVADQLPLDRNGFVTFGSLNNPYKITREVVALWARVMNRVPDSRFLLVRPEVRSFTLVQNLVTEFSKHGISADRIMIFDNKSQSRNHLYAYNEIDISLDTYPVTGGTTTCEALWMGVPVVSLVGELLHQRISYSILMQAGLDEMCAFDEEGYVDLATAMAEDPARLRSWRSGLRDALMASPLCDAERFVFQFQEMLGQVAALHDLR